MDMNQLWESTCSCPSRSICRHILTAILYARSHLSGDDAEPETFGENGFENPEALLAWLQTHRPEYEPVLYLYSS